MVPLVPLPQPDHQSSPERGEDLLVVLDPRFREHEPGHGCPERPERYDALERAVASVSLPFRRVTDVPPASRAELLTAHDSAYVDRVLALRGHRASLDHETHLSPGSIEAASRAAGAALFVVREILGGRARRGLALVRPPGHHAGRHTAMGYCIFNNVAIAVIDAQQHGAVRVLVVDVDVHHGNGTEEILAGVPDVLLVSVHQEGLFPHGSGGVAFPLQLEEGGLLNVPVAPLAIDGDYARIVDAVLVPVAARFRPDLVVVSCGFDAHWRDEQGGMRLSSEGLVSLMAALRRLADVHAEGRVAFVLEGGYDLEALETCVSETLSMLAGPAPLRPDADSARPEVDAMIEEICTRMELSQSESSPGQRRKE